jgi:hypothetical protein
MASNRSDEYRQYRPIRVRAIGVEGSQALVGWSGHALYLAPHVVFPPVFHMCNANAGVSTINSHMSCLLLMKSQVNGPVTVYEVVM